MTTRIRLEPEAQVFAEAMAKPPFLFTLGPERGRIALGGTLARWREILVEKARKTVFEKECRPQRPGCDRRTLPSD